MLRAVRVLFLLGFAGLALSIAWMAWFAMTPIRLPASRVDFSIAAGSSLRSAAQQMITAGIPMAARGFTLLARITGKETQVKAGSYEMAQGETPWTLLRKITRGEYQLSEILFIEGWTFAQMRSALDASEALQHDTLGLADARLMEGLGLPGVSPEGLFFPDTYLFPKGESDVAILARAHRAMERQLESVWENRDSAAPLASPREALVLASIIEKETSDSKERALIAGVFANRLKLGMRLQTDPTVIYGLGSRFDGNLHKKDLAQDTPFNTYTREGLPPHPIAMPGRAALIAAVNPAKTDALYFVSRGDGTHQFSHSLEDHNRAVTSYRKGGSRP
jgi:UPF0755 protein